MASSTQVARIGLSNGDYLLPGTFGTNYILNAIAGGGSGSTRVLYGEQHRGGTVRRCLTVEQMDEGNSNDSEIWTDGKRLLMSIHVPPGVWTITDEAPGLLCCQIWSKDLRCFGGIKIMLSHPDHLGLRKINNGQAEDTSVQSLVPRVNHNQDFHEHQESGAQKVQSGQRQWTIVKPHEDSLQITSPKNLEAGFFVLIQDEEIYCSDTVTERIKSEFDLDTKRDSLKPVLKATEFLNNLHQRRGF
ncbi:uncharacterized protein FTOL_02144 [Fusarium torulosum]|uniref:Uncharacterized protein n=1 Tax=Fusarium torulosum TaxID=33205 RepID=A0AAE8M169_9HYPO|nr:uncharacterized protein FTOL_02144 [Fusarium torulosum]